MPRRLGKFRVTLTNRIWRMRKWSKSSFKKRETKRDRTISLRIHPRQIFLTSLGGVVTTNQRTQRPQSNSRSAIEFVSKFSRAKIKLCSLLRKSKLNLSNGSKISIRCWMSSILKMITLKSWWANSRTPLSTLTIRILSWRTSKVAWWRKNTWPIARNEATLRKSTTRGST